MIINGDGKEVKQFIIRHKGANMVLRHCVYPGFDPFRGSSNEPMYDPYDNVAELTFSDLREVDILIEILTRFKEGVETNYGLWKTDDIGMK